jgi:hypothetical protein
LSILIALNVPTAGLPDFLDFERCYRIRPAAQLSQTYRTRCPEPDAEEAADLMAHEGTAMTPPPV